MRLLLQIISIAFMVCSAYIWARGSLWMTSKTVTELSGTYFNKNSSLVRFLISEKCDTTFAFCFLILGLVTQTVSFYVPNNIVPFIRSWLYGTLFFLALLFVFYTIGNALSRTTEQILLAKIDKIEGAKE